MPDNEWDEMLAAAAAEVLETMFFIGVAGPAPSDRSRIEPHVAARLSFAGTPSGALTVCVTETAVRTLASNFLPSEVDDPLPVSQLGGVVCELSNMICGALLSRAKTEQHFRLSSPELLPEGWNCVEPPPNQSLILGDDLGDGAGDGTIGLWLALEHHAG